MTRTYIKPTTKTSNLDNSQIICTSGSLKGYNEYHSNGDDDYTVEDL